MIAAAYLRKSNDEGEKSEDIKSVTRQLARAREYAASKGWTLDERTSTATTVSAVLSSSDGPA